MMIKNMKYDVLDFLKKTYMYKYITAKIKSKDFFGKYYYFKDSYII